MVEAKIFSSKVVELVNDLGIVRCEEKMADFDRMVWYDVCQNNGEGDIIESFTTLEAARRYAEKY